VAFLYSVEMCFDKFLPSNSNKESTDGKNCMAVVQLKIWWSASIH